MTNDEQDPKPNDDLPSSEFDEGEDDLRYAPPAPAEAPYVAEEADDTVFLASGEIDLLAQPPAFAEPSVEVTEDSLPVNVTDGLDIEAALAAVSTLSDVIAEQEAAEQARVARIDAEAQAKMERQARLDNPERFFAVPLMTNLKRGQLASIIPAIWLMGIGAWLTFTLATTRTLPDIGLLMVVIGLGLGLALVARWLASHRWAQGSLFFGLICLLFAGLFFYTNQPTAFGFEAVWPLFIAAVGLAMFITRILTSSAQLRLTLPSFILIIAGLVGAVITMGLLPTNITLIAASLWPVAVGIIVVIWLFPLVFRQRQ